jgi:peptide chain release factor 1
MFDKLDSVVIRFQELEEKMADPTLYDRQAEFKAISEERSNIQELVEVYQVYKKMKHDLEGAKELLATESDEDMREMAKEEIKEYEGGLPPLEEQLKFLLIPKDPLDEKNCMLEIRAGTGGDEASIFVADVWRMYKNYFSPLGFKPEMVSVSESDKGIKEVILNVTGDKVYSKMKYESGVHRVQRVPETESQGRVHTSAITVAVMPEADEVEFELDMNDVRIDVYRSGGKGGQSVNTTDSAVRITHFPSGIVVTCQNERSQIQNKAKAMKVLKSRLYERELEERQREKDITESNKKEIGWGSQIRSYVLHPYKMVKDHRTNEESSNPQKVLDGDLDSFIYRFLEWRALGELPIED